MTQSRKDPYIFVQTNGFWELRSLWSCTSTTTLRLVLLADLDIFEAEYRETHSSYYCIRKVHIVQHLGVTLDRFKT